MTAFELRPWNSARVGDLRTDIVWADHSDRGAFRSDLDPWLTKLGTVPDPAIDLARVAVGAFAADQLEKRRLRFSRELDLLVHVREPDRWDEERLDLLADLLAGLTGDSWSISVVPETSPVRLHAAELDEGDTAPTSERIALLSGGLDSFAGAVISSRAPGVTYLGHWDNTITKHAQDEVRSWFSRSGRRIDYVQILHALKRGRKVENSTRSRSAFFMAIAVALAGARGARVVEVPENGFTSLNPPLGPERGGAFTTRSTHPVTIARFNRLLGGLAIGITVENPYALTTKGELVAASAASSPGDFVRGAANTLSCAKGDGARYRGGDANVGCGLCVACATRRGSFTAAGVPDRTRYLMDVLAGAAKDKLRLNRAGDVEALGLALASSVSEDDLMAIGPYPDGFDLDAAVELCDRGFEELRHVPLD